MITACLEHYEKVRRDELEADFDFDHGHGSGRMRDQPDPAQAAENRRQAVEAIFAEFPPA